MPIVSINMIAGRTDDQKAELIRAVAVSVSTALDAPIETVRVMILELPSQNWGIGPVTAASRGR